MNDIRKNKISKIKVDKDNKNWFIPPIKTDGRKPCSHLSYLSYTFVQQLF
ncbi:hypothetical protein CHCC20335_3448 [Bacillus paralicheniformis]|nr:hypothetical protein CHCC20335_3448 [Bacillus paralicheniformis]